MRISVLIGFGLVALGIGALYQVSNGFLMSSIGAVYYAPPDQPEALKAAFDDLGDEQSADGGYLLRQVAQARVICTLRETPDLPEPAAAEAYRRLHLMMLGAGVRSTSPVVDPAVHYIGEIRRSWLRDTATWRTSRLNRGEVSRLDDLFEALTAIEHPIYADLPLGEGFNHFALRNMVEMLRTSGQTIHDCVANAKQN